MLLTKELLKSDPWHVICDMINDKFGYRLDPNSVELVELVNLTAGECSIKIARKRSNSPSNLLPDLETDTFKFNKLNLSEIGIAVEVSGLELPTTTFKLFNHLLRALDIEPVSRDLLLGNVTDYEVPVVLKASERSLRFYGEVEVIVKNTPGIDVADYINIRQANTNKIDNSRELRRINGSMLTYTFNFSEHHEYFNMIKTNESYPDASRLSALLRSTTGYAFNATLGFSEYNIINTISENMVGEYKCIYNGPIIPLYSNRKDLSHVLVLELNRLRASNVVGNLILHYNKG